MKLHINTEDIIPIAIEAFAFALPIFFTEEVWKMSVTLPFYSLLLVVILSVTFLGIYTYYSVFQKQVSKRYDIFILHISIAYFISTLVVNSFNKE